MPLVNITEGWQKILPSSVLKQRCKERARTLQHEVSFGALKMAWGRFYPRGSSLPATSAIGPRPTPRLFPPLATGMLEPMLWADLSNAVALDLASYCIILWTHCGCNIDTE
jgi:hypothetical protein